MNNLSLEEHVEDKKHIKEVHKTPVNGPLQPNQAVFFETVSQMIEHLPVVGLRRMNTEDQNHEEASQNI